MGERKTGKKQTKKQVKKQQVQTGFPEQITEFDQYLFSQGTHYDIYKKLGSHVTKVNGEEGIYFAVWAPNAKKVSVVGNFNDWNSNTHVMNRQEPNGVYDLFIPGLGTDEFYKYEIMAADGRTFMKADPFANQAELRPGTASVTTDLTKFKWTDTTWLQKRAQKDMTKEAMSIYEVHIGSWKKHPKDSEKCKNGTDFYNYREFAHEAAAYIKEMGYTHIELIGIAEHPFDGSWGYQVSGYYAPTARYGSVQDFMYMVNYFHKNQIGVILDWVPAHFPKDAHGLAEFDGTCLYEYADPRKGEQPQWGTKIFDFGKFEVKNFLIANALYWVEYMHIDALRVDAVASMLYLNFGKEESQWITSEYGDDKNHQAVELFKHLNSCITGRNPGVMIIAEESTAWPKVTGKVEEDGLGFTFKWNMGWMHDFLDYMKLDPYFRKDNHGKMTFGMMYAYSENYVLVLSHDEVVHLKGSMINKMPGIYEDKFANLKVGYAFMMGHPGKKLLFMGQDFAQFREWSEERELDWYLLQDQQHQWTRAFMKNLLKIYKKYPALYKRDNEPGGFEWINADDAYRSIFSFVRYSENGRRNLLFVCNFTPMARDDYRVGVPNGRTYKLILDSESPEFGGKAPDDKQMKYKAVKQECDGRPFSFAYPLAPYGVAVFEF